MTGPAKPIAPPLPACDAGPHALPGRGADAGAADRFLFAADDHDDHAAVRVGVEGHVGHPAHRAEVSCRRLMTARPGCRLDARSCRRRPAYQPISVSPPSTLVPPTPIAYGAGGRVVGAREPSGRPFSADQHRALRAGVAARGEQRLTLCGGLGEDRVQRAGEAAASASSSHSPAEKLACELAPSVTQRSIVSTIELSSIELPTYTLSWLTSGRHAGRVLGVEVPLVVAFGFAPGRAHVDLPPRHFGQAEDFSKVRRSAFDRLRLPAVIIDTCCPRPPGTLGAW